ncbi:hypothetical protein BH11PSE11_BH11PSE11_38460 [soil metagenome]
MEATKPRLLTGEAPNQPMRAFKVAVAAYLMLALLATYYFILSYPLEITANLIYDDAYYYLGVAKSIAEGKGSSFGDLVQTNGYHPLWLGILASVIYVFSFQKLWAFAAIPALIFLIKSFSLFKLSTLKSEQATPMLLATAMAIMLYPGIFSQGLETCLLLLCLPLLSQIKPLPQELSLTTCLKYSAIFIFLFLVRLDLLAMLAAFCVLSFFRMLKGERAALKNLVLIVATVFAALSLYFVINFMLFGTIVPVSGLSKSLGNKVGENFQIAGKYLGFARFAIIAMLLNYLLIRCTRRTDNRTINTELFSNEIRMAVIASVIVAVYYAMFSGWPIWSWYYWPTALFTLYAVAKLIYLSVVSRKRYSLHYKRDARVRPLLIASWIFLGYMALLAAKTEFSTGIAKTLVRLSLHKEVTQNYTSTNIKLINEFFAHAPEGIVAMGDRAGGLGFWLPERFKFFHTEGLVANKDYLLARKEGKGAAFLQNVGIKYFIVEREQLLEAKLTDGTQVHGIVEPIQGLSAHTGLVLMCFPVDAILYTQRYENQVRHVYDFTRAIECPAWINAKAESLMKDYGEMRRFSLPSEYEGGANWFRKYVMNPN